jgi:hypothetical protein
MIELTKEMQIAEMAVKRCTRNPQAHVTEECFDCEFKNGMCDTYRLAEILYNEGYRKASDVALEVLKEVRELYMIDDRYAALERRVKKKYTEAKK